LDAQLAHDHHLLERRTAQRLQFGWNAGDLGEEFRFSRRWHHCQEIAVEWGPAKRDGWRTSMSADLLVSRQKVVVGALK